MPAAPLARRTPASGGSVAMVFGASGDTAGTEGPGFAEARTGCAVFAARAGFARRPFADAPRLPAIRPLPATIPERICGPLRPGAIRPVSLELTRGRALLMSRAARPAHSPLTGVFAATSGQERRREHARPSVASQGCSMLGFNGLAQRFFGSSNDRKLRPFYRRVEAINALEPAFEAKSDDELRALTTA